MIETGPSQVKLTTDGSGAGPPCSAGSVERVLRFAIIPLIGSLALTAASPTDAAPLLRGRAGGLALVGPASVHPASMLDNPAALGLLENAHVLLDSTFGLQTSRVERSSIDRETGVPGSGDSADSSAFDLTSENFLGATTRLGTDYLVFGLAVHNTWDAVSYLRGSAGDVFSGETQDRATRYHGSSLLFAHVFTTLAASVRLSSNIYVGASFSYVHSWVDYRFVRDVALQGGSTLDPGEDFALNDTCGAGACNYESDEAAEAIHVRGESDGLAFGGGLLWRTTAALALGIGYASAVVGFGGERIPASDRAWVERAPIAGELRASGGGKLIYQLPHTISAGARWALSGRLALDFQLRWVSFRLHDALDIRLTGAEFRERPAVPQRIVHYRGFQDVLAAQLGSDLRLASRLSLQAALMVASSAVRAEAVSGTAIDNWNLDGLLALRWQVAHGLALALGYGLVWVLQRDVSPSAFSPSSLVRCVDGSFDIELDACQRASRGQGLASTVGTYSRLLQRIGVSIAYSWD